ncbi:MAG: OmpA family protein [Hyphomicrobiales bacterium]
MRSLILFFFAAFALLPHAGVAQNIAAQIVQTLKTEQTGPMVRSMVQTGQMQMTPYQPLPGQLDLPKALLPVEFEEGTALLTAGGMTILRELALALNEAEITDSTFQIGSHLAPNVALATSAQPISQRRAQAIVEHLVAFYSVDQSRLIPMGYGQTSPIFGPNPTGMQHERIEVINVSQLIQ